MKINDITQAPFGTILTLDQNLPEGSVGNYLTVDGVHLLKIKGTPSHVWTEVLVEQNNMIEIGQEIKIIKIV